MYLTAEEYLAQTGEAAPADFTACLALAETQFDLHTMDYFAQLGDLTALPAIVISRIKKAVAYQVQAISQSGGVAGVTEQRAQSASLGKYSYTSGAQGSDALCAPAIALIPWLLSYMRGVDA